MVTLFSTSFESGASEAGFVVTNGAAPQTSTPHTGTSALDVYTGSGTTSLTRTHTGLTVGGAYTIAIWVRSESPTQARTATLGVTGIGSSSLTTTGTYQQLVYSFTATSTTHDLVYTGTSSGSIGTFVDDFTLDGPAQPAADLTPGNGTPTTPTYGVGPFGSALLPPTNNAPGLAVPGNFGISSGAWTVEAWVKVDTFGNQVVFGQNLSGGRWLGVQYGRVHLEIDSGIISGSTYFYGDGAWHHIAASSDGSSGTYLYLDGVQEAYTGQSGTIWSSDGTGATGIGNYFGSTNSAPDGVAEVRISSSQRYPRGTSFSVPTASFTTDASTTGLYHLNGSGSDSSGNGYHSYIANGQLFIPGKFGKALLSSPSFYSGYTTTQSFGPSYPATVEYWAKTTATSGTRVAIGNNAVGWIGSNNQYSHVEIWGANFTGTRSIADGAWHHIAVTYDGTTVKQWVDGVLDGSTASSGNTSSLWKSGTMGIGQHGTYTNIYQWDGGIDEVRISNVVRYTSAFTPPTAPFATDDASTAGLFHLNENGAAATGTTTGTITANASIFVDAYVQYETTGELNIAVNTNAGDYEGHVNLDVALHAVAHGFEVVTTTGHLDINVDLPTAAGTNDPIVGYANLDVQPAAVQGASITETASSSPFPTTTLGLVNRTYIPTDSGISVRILRKAPDLSLIDVVHSALNVSIMEEVKGDGAGSFTILAEDPVLLDTPEIAQYLNVAQVVVEGVVRGAFVLKNVHRVLVGDGENAKVAYEFSGPGLREWLTHAVVYPENHNGNPLTDLQPGTRYFNFASPIGQWYNAASWHAPTRMIQVRANTGYTAGHNYGNPWGTSPVGWPDVQGAAVYWTWDRNAMPSAPAGDVYFRRTFATTDTKATYTLFVTCDNGFQAYIDGVPLSAQNKTDSWHYLWEASIDLGPGTHTVAVKGTNAKDGIAGMACLLYKNGITQDLKDNGDTNTNTEAKLIAWSGDGYWKCLGYPAKAPGFTAGEVLKILIDEAKARASASGTTSALQALKIGFTQNTDSNGEAWTEPLDWMFDIGANYHDVVTKLEELACEVRIDPVTFTLQAYNHQGTDRAVQTSTTQPVIFTRGHNVLTAEEDSQANLITHYLLSYGDNKMATIDATAATGVYNPGQVTVQPVAGPSKWGRIEGFAATDASYDLGTAKTVGNKMLELGATPVDSATVTITDVADHTPWKDFKVGDWVLGPAANGTTTRRRVMSITASVNERTGSPQYEVELDSKSQDMADKINQFLQRIPAFSALGTSVAAGSTGLTSPPPPSGTPTPGDNSGGGIGLPGPGDTGYPTVPTPSSDPTGTGGDPKSPAPKPPGGGNGPEPGPGPTPPPPNTTDQGGHTIITDPPPIPPTTPTSHTTPTPTTPTGPGTGSTPGGGGYLVYVQPTDPGDHRLGVLWFDTSGFS